MLDCEEIKAVFDQQFLYSHNTVLIGGADEPVYIPGIPDQHSSRASHQLFYTKDYPASALHEMAHWCLASLEQLTKKDWGHWYVPDGRSVEQQRIFQRVEARVQALEWILSVAAGRPFRESSDNLSGEVMEDDSFKEAIYAQVINFVDRGLPERAGQLFQALAIANDKPLIFSAALFKRQDIGQASGHWFNISDIETQI